MVPVWLNTLAVVSLVVAFACAAIIVADLFRRPQHMLVMNPVWPITAVAMRLRERGDLNAAAVFKEQTGATPVERDAGLHGRVPEVHSTCLSMTMNHCLDTTTMNKTAVAIFLGGLDFSADWPPPAFGSPRAIRRLSARWCLLHWSTRHDG